MVNTSLAADFCHSGLWVRSHRTNPTAGVSLQGAMAHAGFAFCFLQILVKLPQGVTNAEPGTPARTATGVTTATTTPTASA